MRTLINEKAVWINYHHLYYFMMVATEGSIAKVASKLNLGQPALSIQIKQFEESIGEQLFERAHRKLILTESGKVALNYAKEIFKLGNEMMQTLKGQIYEDKFHLQLGSLASIPRHLILSVVELALSEFNCTVTMTEGRPSSLLRDLSQHRLDLLVTNRLPNDSAGKMYKKKIARLPLYVLGAKKFLGLKKNFPKSLDQQPIIFPTPDSQVREELAHYFTLHKINPKILAESQDMMMQKILALRGHGLIVAPEFAVKEYIDEKDLYVLGQLEGVYEELFMVAASRKVDNAVATFLINNFVLKTEKMHKKPY